MKLLKLAASATAALIAAVAGIAFVASPANAAIPYCNNISMIYQKDSDDHFVLSPTYAPNGYNPSYPPTTNCDMAGLHESGTTGEKQAIQLIQESLKYCYALNVSIDGSYGPQTRDAIKKVQMQLGFTGSQVDGWAGPNTRSKMKIWGLDNAPLSGCAVGRLSASYNPWDRKPQWGVPGEFQYFKSLTDQTTVSRLLGTPTTTKTCDLLSTPLDPSCTTGFVGPISPGAGIYISITSIHDYNSSECNIDYTVTRAYLWGDGNLYYDTLDSGTIGALSKAVIVTADHSWTTIGIRLEVNKHNYILDNCEVWATIQGNGG